MIEIPISIHLNFIKLKIMKNIISKKDVEFFKNSCNENEIISEIIRADAAKYFVSPVLDVGCGKGDIAYMALYDLKVIQIDVNNFSENRLSKNHKRYQIDFFDYLPHENIRTILISHTMQFIDDDIDLFEQKIAEINPEFIILVMNKNDGFMGVILDWSKKHIRSCNPEERIPNFLPGYELIDSFEFSAKLISKDFNELAEQISYLMLIEKIEEIKKELVQFLRSQLSKSNFEFKQIMEVYRNGKR